MNPVTLTLTQPAPPNLDDGNCVRYGDPERMFPDPRNHRAVSIAKAECAGCPVLHDCREWALRTREPHGVWGGLSEDDRRALTATRPASVAV